MPELSVTPAISTPHLYPSTLELLQISLRSQKTPFSIKDEYPLLLQQKTSARSFTILEQDSVLAHLHYLPRQLLRGGSPSGDSLTLIGNVATAKRARRQGYMKRLFASALQTAQSENHLGLLLWSDLNSFYQNLGFRSFGQEIRYRFSLRKALGPKAYLVEPESLTDEDMTQLLRLKPTLAYTLKRSLYEFKNLLTIPCLGLAVTLKDQKIQSFAICGKGADMQGVVHEWGGDLEGVLSSCYLFGELLQANELILLAPYQLAGELSLFDDYAKTKELCPMGLFKPAQPNLPEGFESLFVWGLDSI